MNDQVQEQAAETKAEETPVKKMSQKEAVHLYVTEALTGLTPGEGQKLKDLVTKDVRKVVRQKLYTGFKSGQIRMSKEMDESKLKKYCSGLINNWLKKDELFN